MKWKVFFFLVIAQKEMTSDIQPIRKYLVIAKKEGYPSLLRIFSLFLVAQYKTPCGFILQKCDFFWQQCALMKINVPFLKFCGGTMLKHECFLGYHFLQSSYLILQLHGLQCYRDTWEVFFSWLSWLNSQIRIHIMKHLNQYLSIIH